MFQLADRRSAAMPSKKLGQSEFELFGMLLTNMINMGHPLVRAANEIDWTRFDAA